MTEHMSHVVDQLTIRMGPYAEDGGQVAWFDVSIDGEGTASTAIDDGAHMCEWLLSAMMDIASRLNDSQKDRLAKFCIEHELWEPDRVDDVHQS